MQCEDTLKRELREPVATPRMPARWPIWLRRSFELLALLTIAGFLFYDRLRLFQEYFSKYIDEDQGIEWAAAKELLHGKIHEPCFYGQAYNSNLEGFLAAPLVACHVPYEIAVPLATVFLGLLPFLLMAAIAFRRRQAWVGALALFVPLSMSSRYGMITGMPRGFVTGVAIAIFPAVLLLPPLKTGMKGVVLGPDGRLRLQRTWPRTRYFLAAFLSVVAVMLNPNAIVLLAPVAVYALLTTFKEWRFWFFSVLGFLAAAPYPILVHDFYYVWHDDYRLYHRVERFSWSYKNFQRFIPELNDAFHDIVPDALYTHADDLFQWLHYRYPHTIPPWAVDSPAPMALLVLFAIALFLLLLRVRVAAAFATLTGVGLTIFALAYDRLQDSRTAVSFPYARMFLAVPVLLIWLLMLIKRSRPAMDAPISSRRGWPWLRFLRRWIPSFASAAFIGLLIFAGYTVMMSKSRALADEVADAVENGNVARPVEVAEAKRIAKAIQKAADAQHLDFVLFVNDDRKWDYVIPELTTCETLYPGYDRRTWRMVEECTPRYAKILVMGNLTPRGIFRQPPPIRMSQNPPLAVYDLHDQSVDDFCRVNYIHEREFKRPPPPPPRPPVNTPTTAPAKKAK